MNFINLLQMWNDIDILFCTLSDEPNFILHAISRDILVGIMIILCIDSIFVTA